MRTRRWARALAPAAALLAGLLLLTASKCTGGGTTAQNVDITSFSCTKTSVAVGESVTADAVFVVNGQDDPTFDEEVSLVWIVTPSAPGGGKLFFDAGAIVDPRAINRSFTFDAPGTYDVRLETYWTSSSVGVAKLSDSASCTITVTACNGDACQNNPADTSTPDATSDASLTDSEPDTEADVDDLIADVPPLPSCTTVRKPTAAAFEPAQPNALVCNPADNILDEDGLVVGLAYGPQNTVFQVDGVNVSACVRADFGSAFDITQVRVLARSVSTTAVCGDACVGDTCGTGQVITLFGSVDGTTFTTIGSADLYPQLTRVGREVTRSLRYVLACRSGFGHGRDNVEVDLVEICTP